MGYIFWITWIPIYGKVSYVDMELAPESGRRMDLWFSAEGFGEKISVVGYPPDDLSIIFYV